MLYREQHTREADFRAPHTAHATYLMKITIKYRFSIHFMGIQFIYITPD